MQQQDLKTILKNDMIKIWECLAPLLSQEVELDRSEVDLFLSQYKQKYAKEEENVNNE